MPLMRLGPGGVLTPGTPNNPRMSAFTPNRANENPPKRIARIQELLKTAAPKIAVVRGEGIGDVLMTTPAVHELKELFGGRCEITYATNTRYADAALVKVLKNNPDISEVIDRDNVDEANYDTVINLHCPAIGYEKFGNPPINRIDLFAHHMGFTSLKDPTPRLFLTKLELEEGSSFMYRAGLWGKRVMLVQIHGTSPSRSIASATVRNALIKLYQQYKIHSLIMTHNTDVASDITWSDIPGSIVARDRDCREIAAIMCYCDLVLCPDSAILHIAGALSIPTVSLFGPTDPRARVNYYPAAVAIWEGEKLGGHPHWYEKCPYGDLCWKLITEDAIVESCANHMAATKKIDVDKVAERSPGTIIQTDFI